MRADHLEWMRLVTISGPFLSAAVLGEVFPQGLGADDREMRRNLEQAHAEWFENRDDRSVHNAWIDYVLRSALGYREGDIVEGSEVPAELAVRVPEHGETLHPDRAIFGPEVDGRRLARMLVSILSADTDLSKKPTGSSWAADHLSRMAEMLRRSTDRDLSLGLVTDGDQWTLVSAPHDGTTSFVTWTANLWFQEPTTLRAFRDFLGEQRCFGDPDLTLERLIARSASHQNELTDQLGLQVREAIELLVQAIDRADRSDRDGRLLDGISDSRLYEAAVTVMMRLVFVFYAEEQGLLPLKRSALYRDSYALSTLAADLRTRADRQGTGVLDTKCSAWPRMLGTFRAIHGGVLHQDLQLIAHGGDLFDPDRFPFLEGREPGSRWCDGEAPPLRIDDRMALLLLEALQYLRVSVAGGGYETRRLSFRELNVEQIGHVYEGLLDHEVRRAEGAVVSLKGRAGSEPEVAVRELAERYDPEDISALVSFVRESSSRTPAAIRNDLPPEYEIEDEGPWLVACDNDESLWGEIKPFAGLVREDRTGRPVIVRPGSAYVTAGTDRRSSGAHYTPRNLTEPIVRTTLEPLVYEGPAEGRPPEDWVLRGPRELLSLKVCDLACGSGAFLVQTCRYLGERLVESWSSLEARSPGCVLVSPEGDLSEGEPDERPIPKEDAERLAVAKRAVAEGCLYGVDKNHLAVEMAKLSLWLETLQEGKPFQFLDHAIKCGDSLVGLPKAGIAGFHWKPEGAAATDLYDENLRRGLANALGWRAGLHGLGEWDYDRKKELWVRAEGAISDARLVGDLVVAAFFGADRARSREEQRVKLMHLVEKWREGAVECGELEVVVAGLRSGDRPVLPFHWQVEFPEVFERENPGFDAFVGNPPFAGKNTTIAANAKGYIDWLTEVHEESHGNSDLVAHMFRRAFDHLRNGGCLGLIATNTIAQGDTRNSGLRWICENGGVIYEARRRVQWPGQAAVIVSVLHLIRGSWAGNHRLDGKSVAAVTAFLFHAGGHRDPERIRANADKSFQGSIILGMGFTFDDTDARGKANSLADMERLIAKDPRNAEVIFPYIGGSEVNSSPTHAHHRYVFNFGERDEDEIRNLWPDLMEIAQKRVKPGRMKQDDKGAKARWWQFIRPRPEMHAAIAGLERVLAICRHQPQWAVSFMQSDAVFAESLIVIAFDNYAAFAVLQSRPHEIWARFFGSSMKDDLRYTPSDCFETFPFPEGWEDDVALEEAGRAYYEYRAALMIRNDEGLTATYNRFHDRSCQDPEIVKLRELHSEMDRAVLSAYGFELPAECDFYLDYEIDEETWGSRRRPERLRWSNEVHDDVLARQLELNRIRHEQEVASKSSRTPARKGASRRRGSATDGTAQPSMFEE